MLGSQYSRTKINREIRAQTGKAGAALSRLMSERHLAGVVAPEDISGDGAPQKPRGGEIDEPELEAVTKRSPNSKKKARQPQRAGTVRALPKLSSPMLRLVPTLFPPQEPSAQEKSASSPIPSEKKTYGDCADDIAILNAEK